MLPQPSTFSQLLGALLECWSPRLRPTFACVQNFSDLRPNFVYILSCLSRLQYVPNVQVLSYLPFPKTQAYFNNQLLKEPKLSAIRLDMLPL